MKAKFILFVVSLYFRLTFELNVICNGDFQGHILPFYYWNEQYRQIPSNSSCWYNKKGGLIQLKRKFYPPATTTSELVTQVPYVLCQKVQLQVGKIYNVSLNTVNCWTMTYSTVIVTINNVWLMNVSAYKQFSFGRGWSLFAVKQKINELCFDSAYYIQSPLYQAAGPCIDNVSIILFQKSQSLNTSSAASSNTTITKNPNQSTVTNIANNSNTKNTSNDTTINNTTTSIMNNTRQNFVQMQIQVNCTTSYNQQSLESINFECTYQNVGIGQFLQNFGDQVQISINKELQTNFRFRDISPTNAIINIFPNRGYYIQSASLYSPLLYMGRDLKFKVSIDGTEIIFTALSDEEIEVIDNFASISQTTIELFQKLYIAMKNCFFSYFFLDLISFWNLSIMYNFLNISTAPFFSRNFFEHLEKLMFKLDSISTWIIEKIPETAAFLNFSSQQQRQLMNDFQKGRAWFGYFGFSSNFLQNNIDQIIVFCLLCLKIVVLFLLKKINSLPNILRRKIPKGLRLIQIFLHELIGLSVFTIISAGTVILNSGFIISKQKLNHIVQLLAFFICIMLVQLFWILDLRIRIRRLQMKCRKLQKKLQQKRDLKRQKYKQTRQLIIASFNKTLYFLTYILIPSLILLKNVQCFLFINTLVLGFRCFWFTKFMKTNCKKLQKISTALNLIAWVVHHGAYMALWVVQKIFEYKSDFSDKQMDVFNNMIKITGFITMFTVLLGGFFEVGNFMLQILTSTVRFIAKVIKGKFENKIMTVQQVTVEPKKQKKENPKIGVISTIQNIKTYSMKLVKTTKINRLQVIYRQNVQL